MKIRLFTWEEKQAIASLLCYGLITRWHWTVAFDAIELDRPIDFRTDQLIDRTNLSTAVADHWVRGGAITLHNFHPTAESFSIHDFIVLAQTVNPVHEMFAHTADGTIYRAVAIDRHALNEVLGNYDLAGAAARKMLIYAMRPSGHPLGANHTSKLLQNHVISLALDRTALIDYNVKAGGIWQDILSTNSYAIEEAVSSASECFSQKWPDRR